MNYSIESVPVISADASGQWTRTQHLDTELFGKYHFQRTMYFFYESKLTSWTNERYESTVWKLPANRNSPNPNVCHMEHHQNHHRPTRYQRKKKISENSLQIFRDLIYVRFCVNRKRVPYGLNFSFFVVVSAVLFEFDNFHAFGGLSGNKGEKKTKISIKWMSAAGGHEIRYTTNWKVFYDSICIIHGTFRTLMCGLEFIVSVIKTKIPY